MKKILFACFAVSVLLVTDISLVSCATNLHANDCCEKMDDECCSNKEVQKDDCCKEEKHDCCEPKEDCCENKKSDQHKADALGEGCCG